MFAKTTKEDLRYDDEKDPPLINQRGKTKKKKKQQNNTISTRKSPTEFECEAESLDDAEDDSSEEEMVGGKPVKNTAIQ